ncbi:alpha/beta hydrolase [Aquimarina sp. AD10]|uniref:AB hydrolase-1 domain-containing protein n=1 Tax=Aquimarina aggregata TaxID=1642818 RepID=A0A163CAY1_9FLAO|nr:MULTISPECIES: alpha/beta hydrolase [Aquimarina]AXT59781.1 alpha/beta hydrolase [Aquimarina sp. AD10]KZS42232.1 hypothetical protein AWE51_01970 [Aquimarina aggregata]RKM97651.1 alpha/beta hydrolase [Aquimarina sp. AD10]
MELIFDIEGLRLKAKTWGDISGTPVLAIHGWLDNANTFDKLGPLLSSDLYLVAIDLAGHGLSDHRSVNSAYYLWDYARDIINITEILGWKKFTILAHSMGTGIASIVAGSMPNLIDKLIFIDGLGAPFVVEQENIVSNFKRSIKQLKMAKKTKLYGFSSSNEHQFTTKEEAVHDRMSTSIGAISYESSSCLTERSLYKTPKGYRWRYDPRIVLPECYRMTEVQAQLFIREITCETLIILGNQGLFSDGMFNERLNEFKHREVHWIDGGHHLHLEDKHNEIVTLIKQFLQIEF